MLSQIGLRIVILTSCFFGCLLFSSQIVVCLFFSCFLVGCFLGKLGRGAIFTVVADLFVFWINIVCLFFAWSFVCFRGGTWQGRPFHCSHWSSHALFVFLLDAGVGAVKALMRDLAVVVRWRWGLPRTIKIISCRLFLITAPTNYWRCVDEEVDKELDEEVDNELDEEVAKDNKDN